MDSNSSNHNTKKNGSTQLDWDDDQVKSLVFVHSLVDDLPLTPEAYRVFCHLHRRAGKNGDAFPSYASIANVCFGWNETNNANPVKKPVKSKSARQIAIKAVQELQAFNLIKIQPRYRQDGSQASNEYFFTAPSDWILLKEVVAGDDHLVAPDDQVVAGDDQGSRQRIPHEGNPNKDIPFYICTLPKDEKQKQDEQTDQRTAGNTKPILPVSKADERTVGDIELALPPFQSLKEINGITEISATLSKSEKEDFSVPAPKLNKSSNSSPQSQTKNSIYEPKLRKGQYDELLNIYQENKPSDWVENKRMTLERKKAFDDVLERVYEGDYQGLRDDFEAGLKWVGKDHYWHQPNNDIKTLTYKDNMVSLAEKWRSCRVPSGGFQDSAPKQKEKMPPGWQPAERQPWWPKPPKQEERKPFKDYSVQPLPHCQPQSPAESLSVAITGVAEDTEGEGIPIDGTQIPTTDPLQGALGHTSKARKDQVPSSVPPPQLATQVAASDLLTTLETAWS